MQFLVALFVVSFLKKNISSYAGILQLSVIFNRGGGNIYINSSDCAVFMVN